MPLLPTFPFCDVQNTAFLSTLTDRPIGQTTLQVIGTVIYHFPVLDSTNACALKLLSQIRPKEGTIISADFQTAGRGQISKRWHSAPGQNLCLSCILFPDIKAQDQFIISMAVAIAVRDTVADICDQKQVTVKWPNDIYVDDKKIAGILIQNSVQGNAITSCVAGIGLNVNETDFPADLPNPTSLKLETIATSNRELPIPYERSRIVDSWDVLAMQERFLRNLSDRLQQIETMNSQLYETYNAMLYRRNVQSRFRLISQDSIRSGTIMKVDVQGRLVIQWENGEIGMYQNREVEYV